MTPTPAARSQPRPSHATAFDVKNLSIWYGEKQAIKNVTIAIPPKSITAIIGPSGCGKSTFLRCLNRMHELVPRTRVEGKILFYGEDLYAVRDRSCDGSAPGRDGFPEIESLSDHVDRRECARGLRLNGVRDRQVLNERLEKSLRMAALWDEVKNDLEKARHEYFRRTTAAALHRARTRRGTGGAPDGRALFRTRSHRHRQDRGAHSRAARQIHDRDRDAQYATGQPRLRQNRLLLCRRIDRVRRNHRALSIVRRKSRPKTTSPDVSAECTWCVLNISCGL